MFYIAFQTKKPKYIEEAMTHFAVIWSASKEDAARQAALLLGKSARHNKIFVDRLVINKKYVA